MHQFHKNGNCLKLFSEKRKNDRTAIKKPLQTVFGPHAHTCKVLAFGLRLAGGGAEKLVVGVRLVVGFTVLAGTVLGANTLL